MAEPFLGEIRMFAGTFAPYRWAFCDGAPVPIQQNTALFSLLGTQYGGDGRTTFALPNLQGRSPVGHGQGPGLTEVVIGDQFGAESVTLTPGEMPSHTHAPRASTGYGSTGNPSNGVWAVSRQGRATEKLYGAGHAVAMGPVLAPAGSSQPHNNLAPYQVLNFIIALAGIFPPRP